MVGRILGTLAFLVTEAVWWLSIPIVFGVAASAPWRDRAAEGFITRRVADAVRIVWWSGFGWGVAVTLFLAFVAVGLYQLRRR